MKKYLITLFFSTMVGFSFAASTSPEGKWITIDDETGKPKSIVTIWLENGELSGKIEALIAADTPNPVCEACTGSRKNQPIIGMTFLWGLTQDGDEWTGGKIIDPATGKEYKAKLTVAEDGKTLDVRGFVGIALMGRTQTWQRAER